MMKSAQPMTSLGMQPSRAAPRVGDSVRLAALALFLRMFSEISSVVAVADPRFSAGQI
jgi:hypothetical protein